MAQVGQTTERNSWSFAAAGINYDASLGVYKTKLATTDYSAISNGFNGDRKFSYEGIMELKDKAFSVGKTNAFSNIIDDFFKKSDEQLKKVDDYLDLASQRIEDIKACLDKDDAARRLANSEAEKITLQQFPIYKTENGVKVTTGQYDDNAWRTAKENKRDEVWRRENCYLWGD